MASRNLRLAELASNVDISGAYAPSGAGGEASGIAVYNTFEELPSSGNQAGDIAFVSNTNAIYINNSTGWYSASLSNPAPVITGIDSAYTLSSNGTPLVITGAVEAPSGFPLTWSYTVSSGSLENNGGYTATISQSNNEFTITPTNNSSYAGVFSIDISVTDGMSTDTITVTLKHLFGTAALTYTHENVNAHNSSANDYFGRFNSTCMNDSYMVIVAHNEGNVSGVSGRIFVYDTTTRVLVTSYTPQIFSSFGWFISLSDNNKLIVGSGIVAQTAYILDVLTGAILQTLTSPNVNTSSTQDYFGNAVGISPNGNYAIVGASREDDANGTDSGNACIYDVTDGSLLYTLANPNIYGTGASDYFGYSVAISNSYAAVGAYQEGNAGGNSSGALYIYDLADGSLKWSIENPNIASTQAADQFAWSIAMTDTYVVAGSHGEDFPSSNDGVVYQFDIATGTLIRTLSGTSSAVNLGYSVNCYGNLIFAMSITETLAGAGGQGTAYLFDATTGNQLLQIGYPNTRDPSTTNDQFGYYPAALTSNYIVITAPNEYSPEGSPNSGAAYIFDVTDGTLLERKDNPNLYGGTLNDSFGHNISVGPSQVVVGAYLEDKPISGGLYTDTGVAYQFNKITGDLEHTFLWPQYSGATQTAVRFGWATAANSTYSVVSAPYETQLNVDYPSQYGNNVAANPFTAPNNGIVYVFDKTTGAQVTAITNPIPRGYQGSTLNLNPYFGETLSIGDTLLAVGHPQGRGGSSFGLNNGKVYLYNMEDWSLRYSLTLGQNIQNYFGQSISIYNKSSLSFLQKTYNSNLGVYVTGNWLAVGAKYSTSLTGGSIYVYDAADGTLIKTIAGLNISNQNFGQAVSINSEYLAAGNSTTNAVTIYKLNYGAGWQLYKTFTTTSLGLPTGFGYQVELTDDGKVIVGAHVANNTTEGGRVYVIDIETSTLEVTIVNPNIFGTPSSDYFGFSMGHNNGTIVASAYQEDDETGTSSGVVYQFSI